MSTILSSETQTRIKDAGKHVMQIMTMQCQSIYTSGMTENAFIDAVYDEIAANNRTNEGVRFFQQVYGHLAANHSLSDIESLETGNTTLDLYQKTIDCPTRTYQNMNITINALIEDSNGKELIPPVIWLILFLLAILLSGDSRNEEEEEE